MDFITADDLHAAADKVGMQTSYAENSMEEGSLIAFAENAVFHPPLDPLAVGYGVMVGIRAALDKLAHFIPKDGEARIVLVIDEETFAYEEAGNVHGANLPSDEKAKAEFTDADLVGFGKEANEYASHWLGYQGWQALRGTRFVFAPEDTVTGF